VTSLVKDFPLFPLEKILKMAGKEVGVDRVSKTAVLELKRILLERAEEIATRAVLFAKHAKRVTVKGEDIKLAIR